MAKVKEVPAVEVAQTPAEPQTTNRQATVLTTVELATLSMLVANQHTKPSDIEKGQLQTTRFEASKDVIASLMEKGGENTRLVTVEDGIVTVTPYGIKWVLESRTFGYNFKAIFGKLNLSALHSAFFQLAEELSARHAKAFIYYKNQEGKPSSFWQKFYDAVSLCDECLETPPVPDLITEDDKELSIA